MHVSVDQSGGRQKYRNEVAGVCTFSGEVVVVGK
jgi:hypothetical protein